MKFEILPSAALLLLYFFSGVVATPTPPVGDTEEKLKPYTTGQRLRLTKNILGATWTDMGIKGKVAVGAGAALAIGATAAGINSIVSQAHPKLTFVIPNEKTVWQCGTTVDINVSTFGMGSFYHLSRSVLTLLDTNGRFVLPVMSEKTAKFIQAQRSFYVGSPRHGSAHFTWHIPESLAGGNFSIKYEQQNAFHTFDSDLIFYSNPFGINCSGSGVMNNVPAANASFPNPAPTSPMTTIKS